MTTTGTMASTITINGGAGTDKLVLKDTGLVDVDLTNVTNVETLELSAASTVTLGAQAQEAGIRTITLSDNAHTVNASDMTAAVTITWWSWCRYNRGGSGNDIIGGSGNDIITVELVQIQSAVVLVMIRLHLVLVLIL